MTEAELGELMAIQARADAVRQTAYMGFKQRQVSAYRPTPARRRRGLRLEDCASILAVLTETPGMTKGEIMGVVDETAQQVRGRLEYMMDNGHVRREGRGRWVRYYRIWQKAK